MTSIALVAAKGSPGATTLSLAMGAVWPCGRRVVVVECDPSGGDVAARFGLPVELGTASLVLARRRLGPDATVADDLLLEHAQQLPGGLDVVVGPAGADGALALDEELSTVGLGLAARSDGDSDGAEDGDGDGPLDLIVDCGRLMAKARGQQRLVAESDRLVLVARPDASSLVHAHWAAGRIRAARGGEDGLSLVTVGEAPFPPAEMAEALGIELLGSIRVDPRAADMVCGRPGRRRALARSALISSATTLVRALDLERPEIAVAAELHDVTALLHGSRRDAG